MKVEKQFKPLSQEQQIQKLDRQLQNASQMYEKHFLREMVKAMRNSVSHSKLTQPGMAERIYKDQLDDQYVDQWMDQGGTGFADMIYKELINKYYPQLGQKQPAKQIRPMNITDRFQGFTKPSTKTESTQSFHIQLAPAKGQSYLKLPWKGKFEGEVDLGNGQKAAMFSHPFGLKSTFVFQGQMKTGLLNKELSAGENFASLSPDLQSMTWQIQPTNSQKAL